MDELRALAVVIVICAVYLGYVRRPWQHAAQLAAASCVLVLVVRWGRDLIRPGLHGVADFFWPAAVVLVVWGVARLLRMGVDRCSTRSRRST